MGIELLEVVADRLAVGQPSPFAVRDESGQLLLAAGSVVSSAAQLAMLRQRGLYVDQPDDDEPDQADEAASAVEEAGGGGSAPTVFERWQRAPRRLERLLSSLVQAGFAQRCAGFAADLSDLVARDADIALYHLVRLDPQQRIRHGLSHALRCAALALLACPRAGWQAPRTHSLVQAALTMNLSIVDVQGLYASLGRLNSAQRERLQAHPQDAHDRLREAGIDDDDWLNAVLQHHERVGGGGYPRQLQQVHEMAQALRMLDTFLAKIGARAGRAALPVQEAARQLYQDWPGQPLAAAIIKEVGIAPPGHFVQLASGELAIVVRRGGSPRTPLAAAVTDVKGRPVTATTPRDTAQPAYGLRSLTPDDRHLQRVPPERLYGLVR